MDEMRPWQRRRMAVAFAERIANLCEERKWAKKIREADGTEHNAVAKWMNVELKNFLGDMGAGDGTFLAEGEGKSSLYYQLLGTDSHPDAAVVKPFRCAFEFDRQGATGFSDFKTALLKAAAHSISGAYDATLFVYTLRRDESHAGTYLEDYEPYTFPPHVVVEPTQTLLKRLSEFGVVWAFVPPG